MKRLVFITHLILLINLQSVSTLLAQDSNPCDEISGQSYDPNYIAPTPASPAGTETRVYIDAAHNNFHTADCRYKPFADLLRNDGYVVKSFNHAFSPESLSDIKILVISNPVNDSNTPESNWVSPILSAFTDDEIDAVVNWVEEGGSLMLIADHYPFAGAVENLAKRFGLTVDNGYNFDPNYFSELRDSFFELPIIVEVQKGTADPNTKETANSIFSQASSLFVDLGAEVNTLVYWPSKDPDADVSFAEGDGNLTDHFTTGVRLDADSSESVPYITTFTGHSFTFEEQPDLTFHPLLVMGEGTYTVLTEAQDAYFGPDVESSNNNMLTSLLTTGDVPDFVVPTVDSSGTLQAVLVEAGEGNVVFFAEAGMFTAQIAADGETHMGMNNSMASHNWQYALNVVRFLDGFLPVVSSPAGDEKN